MHTRTEADVTAVVFRKWPKRAGGDVVALMPYEDYDNTGSHCTCYEHLGQHGGADYAGVIAGTKAASVAEYTPLLRELKQIGYRVRVITRAQRRKR